MMLLAGWFLAIGGGFICAAALVVMCACRLGAQADQREYREEGE